MDNNWFGKTLKINTKIWTIDIIKLSIKLPDIPKGKVIKTQLAKSGASIGANDREANTRSKADFSGEIRIWKNETGETVHWVEIKTPGTLNFRRCTI